MPAPLRGAGTHMSLPPHSAATAQLAPSFAPRAWLARLSLGQQAWALLFAHLLLWTALPLLLSRNLPIDVVEALAWGREWQWGYYKHPPLSGWLAEIARVGAHDWPLYLLSQLMVAGGLLASWLLGRTLLGPRLALYALMAMEGVHYFNLSSTEFNANVVMFPFWAWACLCFWRAVHGGAWRWWLGLGLCCGMGTLGKYVFLLLPASLFLYSLLHPAVRRVWRTAGPWSAMLVFALLVAPHVQWAVALDWPTLHYALGRGHTDELAKPGGWGHEFINFVLAQGLTLLPLWLLLRALGPTRPARRPSADRWLLITMAAGPLLLIMLAASLAQAKMLHMWASPFFICMAPLWLALREPVRPQAGRFVRGWAAWVALSVLIFAAAALFGPQAKHKLDRTSYPGREVAQALSAQWRHETGQPLAIVGGEPFVAATVAQYAPDRPTVFYDADFSESLWLTPEQLERDGAVLVWPVGRGEVAHPPADSREQVAALQARYPGLQARPTLLVHTTWLGKPYTVAVAWAVLPPGGGD
jgi:4-amino-4-deoxy-L-arabinose transferase-like glycosyltransferase